MEYKIRYVLIFINLLIAYGVDSETTESTISTGTTNDSAAPKIDLQMQIYILSGAVGGVLVLLIILVLALALSIARIKDLLRDYQSPNDYKKGPSESIYGVTKANSGPDTSNQIADFKSTAEQMGYEMYSGNAYSGRRPTDINNNGSSFSRAQLQNEIRNSFKVNDRRNDYSQHYQATRPPQLRLKEEVTQAGSSLDNQDRRQSQRNRYQE